MVKVLMHILCQGPLNPTLSHKHVPKFIAWIKYINHEVTPKFCKQYARVGDVINKALLEYKEDVTNGSFPDAHHSPYKISETDANGFLNELQSWV